MSVINANVRRDFCNLLYMLTREEIHLPCCCAFAYAHNSLMVWSECFHMVAKWRTHTLATCIVEMSQIMSDL